MAALRLFVVYFDKLGSASFRRWIAERVPWRNFQACKGVIDSMDDEACKIVDERKAAMAKGGEAVIQEYGQRKDLLSLLG